MTRTNILIVYGMPYIDKGAWFIVKEEEHPSDEEGPVAGNDYWLHLEVAGRLVGQLPLHELSDEHIIAKANQIMHGQQERRRRQIIGDRARVSQ